MHICTIQFEKTYHYNEVVISIWVLFKPQNDLLKAGVELHYLVKVLLIILVNSALMVSILYSSSSDQSILI